MIVVVLNGAFIDTVFLNVVTVVSVSNMVILIIVELMNTDYLFVYVCGYVSPKNEYRPMCNHPSSECWQLAEGAVVIYDAI